jgi:hypothetical protein
VDSYLLSIIEAAEAGAPTPGIHVMTTGGDWIRGQPCSSADFRSITWQHFVINVNKYLKSRPRRERKENPLDADAEAAGPFAAVTDRRAEGSEPTLSLSQATLSFSGRGDGMNLPAVRIPIQAISSWWVCGENYIKPSSSGGLIGGVVFPIGN